MAIRQVNDFAVGDVNLTSMMETINKSYKGKADFTLSELDTDNAPVVKVGSIFDNNGAIIIVESSDETPTGYSGITNETQFYLYYNVTTEAFIYLETVPTWSDALQGWYNGNDRALYSMYKDKGGTLYISKAFLVNEGEVRRNGTIISTFNNQLIDLKYLAVFPNAGVDNSFSTPGIIPIGVAYDTLNQNLISFDAGTSLVYIHDGISSTILSSFSASSSTAALVYDQSTGNLIDSNNVSLNISIHDGITSTILSSFSAPSNGTVGLAYDPITGNLISVDRNTDTIYIHDGVTSTILSSFATPALNPAGLTIDTLGNLISFDSTTDLVYVHNGISDVISFSYENNITDNNLGLTYSITNNIDDNRLISISNANDTIYVYKRKAAFQAF